MPRRICVAGIAITNLRSPLLLSIELPVTSFGDPRVDVSKPRSLAGSRGICPVEADSPLSETEKERVLDGSR